MLQSFKMWQIGHDLFCVGYNCIMLLSHVLFVARTVSWTGGRTENSWWTYLSHPPNTSFLTIPFPFVAFGKKLVDEKITCFFCSGSFCYFFPFFHCPFCSLLLSLLSLFWLINNFISFCLSGPQVSSSFLSHISAIFARFLFLSHCPISKNLWFLKNLCYQQTNLSALGGAHIAEYEIAHHGHKYPDVDKPIDMLDSSIIFRSDNSFR